MFKLRRAALFVILYFAITSGKIPAQVFWKINGETGYFKSDESKFPKITNDLLTRLESEVGYRYLQTDQSAIVSFKLRPILYGITNSMKTIKGKLAGTYYHEFDKISLTIDANVQQQVYDYGEFNADYLFTTLRSALSYLVEENIDLNTEAGYSTYDINSDGIRRSLDFLFLNLNMNWYANPNSTLGTGLYFEKFSNKIPLQYANGISNKSSGFRFGPEISLKYLKSFILSANYRLLFHNSEVTANPSYEHLLQLMAGKCLFSEFTAFIMVDYYSRKFKIKNNPSSVNLLYTPLNLENHYYFKLGYDIKENTELYIKSGYSKESLFINDLSLAGWNFLIGIGIKSLDPDE